MPLTLILVLYTLLPVNPIVEAFPSQGSVGSSEFRQRGAERFPETTSEAGPNSTEGLIKSVWHKISNIFGNEETTPHPDEEDQQQRHEILTPRDSGNEAGRDLRMSPEDFSRRNNDEIAPWQSEVEDEGNLFPNRPEFRLGRASEEEAEENEQRSEVRSREFDKTQMSRIKRSGRTSAPVIFEEFDQGEVEGKRIKRFNFQKSTDWRTEKIVVGSDPVENIDKENYIEETNNGDFPFHTIDMKPIIIQDGLSQDIPSAPPQRELQPLKIIDF